MRSKPQPAVVGAQVGPRLFSDGGARCLRDSPREIAQRLHENASGALPQRANGVDAEPRSRVGRELEGWEKPVGHQTTALNVMV